MSKKRRLRAEASERQRDKTMTQVEYHPKGTIPTYAVGGATTGGLLKTFSTAAKFSITFIIFFILFIRLMSWLSVFEWSKSRCQLLSPGSLKTADLKSLLSERGIGCPSELSRQDLEQAVWETGGLMEIEMDSFLEADDSTNNTQRDAERFETWNEFKKSVSQKSVGVYLVLCSTELEQKVSELKPWSKFLYRLSKHGVKFVFVRCDADGACDSPKVTLLPIWISGEYKHWNYYSYAGPMRPSDIFEWITETLSVQVRRANKTIDVFNEEYRSTPSMVAHSTRPLPLSYAVLASELKDRVSFFWVETLDEYLPDRASLMVVDTERFVVYHGGNFLNQREIRWLLRLSMMDGDDLYTLFGMFLAVVAMTIPFVAEGSVWQRVKAMLLFLLLCVLASVLFDAWEVRYNKDCHEAMQFLATSFATVINHFQPHFLLLFHLFFEYPLMNLVFPAYALMATFSGRIREFSYKDRKAFIRRLFRASETSDSMKTTSVTPVSTTTSTQMELNAAKTTAQIPSDVTMATIRVPLDAAKTTVKIAFNITKATVKIAFNITKATVKIAFNIIKATVKILSDATKTTAQLHSDVTMATGSADGRNGCTTDDPSAPNRRVIAVTQSQSLESQNNSVSNAGPIQHDPAALLSPSNGTVRSCSTTQPFEYPPLVDSANGDLDKTTAEQMTRLKIPKLWFLPIVSEKELKLSLALQKSVAHDQRSFEPASRTVPRCFYCGVDFQPTSEVRVLPCRDIFHPGCMDDWMKAGNIDCPLCQIPLYATDIRNLS